jgi:ABC-type Fe3+-siderophore transport system permease subunit
VTEPEEQEQDPSLLARAATRQVRILQEAVDRYQQVLSSVQRVATSNQVVVRNIRRVLAVALAGAVLSVAASITLGIVVNQLNDDNVASCQAGNTFRANDQLRWDDFIGLLTTGNAHPSAAALAEAHKYLALVAKTDTLRNC